ncbi:branched-chain alpha-keto acid dehydrogenase subunit E2 [Streptomyces eurocidicus]|uniref:Dihydrolipoamide acetyltransferase component of pyruvate dehydrogenase complex n=1 Tax=Streptomyces eurocidicus TaxID=66423 RepID=A0A2N8NYC6_STREU|nr:dihydrolipoamide acetyltransferase family protein [Streptomyces eurocidicus]MBB5119898.1 pyruvate dehydrogenase E2 component (dihydrolipoamide acetyltransferase) [Streptomyces eurocidicus]MBF6050914.1 2-oxo acid dehydrogenase subunit E2 [Streptomyces eurocidicus]PNE33764.1 branched-chain alpha-keto acid dehydrogenase subunit E2 [Streptomyces eurocidicus]
MAVVREFTLPDLGEGLTEAEIVRWLVQVGDVVAVDQPVVEVETAKAMVEVPCPYGGVVTARFGEEGTELPVGAPLLTVAVGEPATGSDGDSGPEDTGRDSGTLAPPGGEGSGNVLVGYGTQAPAARRPRVRAPGGRAARTQGGPVATGEAGKASEAGEAVGAGRSAGAVGSVRAAAPVEAGTRAVISPLVRRLARERGLDLAHVCGSGPDGLITRADVERATASPAPVPGRAAVASGTPSAAGRPEDGAERIPLRGMRGAVAEKLGRSRREIPDATCWVDADATELLAARRAMNAAGDPKISLLAVLARITTAALARYPELNATVDTEAREIVRLPGVHLGFAAQTDRGLVVPVVRNAHTLNAVRLSEEIARLTEAARAGALTPAELTGGTFTLNNYGVFGVDGSTPIINHPEAAMLGVGRIVPKPWVWEGELAVRQVVQLSFTFDHRVCDGGTAGGFLRYVADCVERPAVLLRSV